MSGKFYLSSARIPEPLYGRQTAILTWLKSLGHEVSFARDYDLGPRPAPEPRLVSGLPVVEQPQPARTPWRRPRRPPPPVSTAGELVHHVGKPCPYCSAAMTPVGHRQATRDHKHPRSRGGTLGVRNKLIVCARCNNDKDSFTLEEWHAALKAAGDARAEKVGWILLDETKGRGGISAKAPAPMATIHPERTVELPCDTESADHGDA